MKKKVAKQLKRIAEIMSKTNSAPEMVVSARRKTERGILSKFQRQYKPGSTVKIYRTLKKIYNKVPHNKKLIFIRSIRAGAVNAR
jgi:predicted transcriptional regulator